MPNFNLKSVYSIDKSYTVIQLLDAFVEYFDNLSYVDDEALADYVSTYVATYNDEVITPAINNKTTLYHHDITFTNGTNTRRLSFVTNNANPYTDFSTLRLDSDKFTNGGITSFYEVTGQDTYYVLTRDYVTPHTGLQTLKVQFKFDNSTHTITKITYDTIVSDTVTKL